MGKRYYWLKLPDDFFRQKPIKKLRRIAGGDTYTIIYLKMLLVSLKNEGKLFFDGVEENFTEEIALELDEEEENVKVTVQFLMAQGLLQLIDESEYELTECSRMVGSESASAERMRRLRDQLEILLLGRRKADGNYVGKDNIYTNSAGITRYSPLAEWRHEDILAYIHYYDVKLPPIYDWEKGYLCGTHPWPARQYMETEQQGWKEVYDIDKTIVENAVQHFDGAREFLKAIK